MAVSILWGEAPAALDWPGERGGLDHHAAQPGMGVDEAAAGERDQQVVLARTRAYENDVAGLGRGVSLGQPGGLRRDQPGDHRAVAQPVAARLGRPPAARGERRRDHPDAVESERGVASVKAKRRAGERFGGRGELGARCPRGHAGLG